jgi:hypothetical protein
LVPKGNLPNEANVVPNSRASRQVSKGNIPKLAKKSAFTLPSSLTKLDKSQTQILIRSWDAIVSGLAACGFKHFDLTSREANLALCSLTRLPVWIYKMMKGSGSGYAMSQLKAQLSLLRSHGLSHTPLSIQTVPIKKFFRGTLHKYAEKFDHCLQLSFISRALPAGDDAIVKRSLREHWKAYSSEHQTPQSVLCEATAYAQLWAERFLKGLHCLPASVSLTEGACLESSRANGGLATALS